MKKGVDYIGVSAGVMIFNDKGELFLSKRSKKTSNEHGCWETPGGSVEFGETLEKAVRREVKEEYCVDIDIIEQFPTADHLIPAEKQHWVATTFLVKVKEGQKPKIMEPDKCDGIGWFPLDNLPSPLSIITKHDLKIYDEKYKTEMIDIVDKNGNILYKTSKSKAHELGLLHKTVIAEIIDSKKRNVLVKQSSERQDAGQFVSPVGGHIRSGETEEEALHREAFEEVGFKEFDYKYIGKTIYNRKILGRQENHYFILYEIYSDDIPQLNHESVGYEKFTKQQLKKQIKNNSKKFGDAYYFVLKNFYPELIK